MWGEEGIKSVNLGIQWIYMYMYMYVQAIPVSSTCGKVMPFN